MQSGASGGRMTSGRICMERYRREKEERREVWYQDRKESTPGSSRGSYSSWIIGPWCPFSDDSQGDIPDPRGVEVVSKRKKMDQKDTGEVKKYGGQRKMWVGFGGD